MLLPFLGVGMRAQSAASGQMDERFNDGTKMPYGWFAEGWKVDDGVVKAKAVKDKENNGFPGSTGTGNNNSMPGGGMNMFGGDRIRTYLLTPPVDVEDGEDLVFSVQKSSDKKGGGFSFDLKAMMGFSDTIFVVERSVYGKNQWLRVGDFTTDLSDEFQTFTISNTPQGKYRFRFISYVDAEIDSVAASTSTMKLPTCL